MERGNNIPFDDEWIELDEELEACQLWKDPEEALAMLTAWECERQKQWRVAIGAQQFDRAMPPLLNHQFHKFCKLVDCLGVLCGVNVRSNLIWLSYTKILNDRERLNDEDDEAVKAHVAELELLEPEVDEALRQVRLQFKLRLDEPSPERRQTLDEWIVEQVDVNGLNYTEVAQKMPVVFPDKQKITSSAIGKRYRNATEKGNSGNDRE